MFVELFPALLERPFVLTLTAIDGKVQLMVAPKKLASDENPAFWTPFSATDTPEQLDAELSKYLTGYVAMRSDVTKSLADSLKEAEQKTKAAAEEAKKKLASKAVKPAAPSKPAAVVSSVQPTLAIESDDDDDSNDEGNEDRADKLEVPAPVVIAASVPALSPSAAQVALF